MFIWPHGIFINLLSFRLEEKISDMETADQVLRRQALMNNPSGKLSGHLPSTTHVSISAQLYLGTVSAFGSYSFSPLDIQEGENGHQVSAI